MCGQRHKHKHKHKNAFKMQNYRSTQTGDANRLREYTSKNTAFYDAEFLQFCQAHLPSEINFWVNDLDMFAIRQRAGDMMFLELKKNGYAPKPNQVRGFKIIDALMRAGQRALGGWVTISINDKEEHHRVNYRGFFLVTLTGATFDASDIYWGAELISKDELIKRLSFQF